MDKKRILKNGLSFLMCASMLFGSGCGTAKKASGTAFSSLASEQPVRLVANAVWTYMQTDGDVPITELQSTLGYTRSNRFDMGEPVRISFSWETNEGVSVKSASIDVSESAKFTDALSYPVDLREDYASVYNLKTGTKYYYRLNLRLSDNTWARSTGEFETAETPRFMYVTGASNVRDIGGWNSTLGGKLKQGMLYRGSEIDGKKNTNISGFCIDEAGKETMLSVMGIKSDFDLRNPSELGLNPNSAGILGESVTRTFLPSAYYEQILSQPETLKTAFTAFANPDAYPVYLHCTHGVDRAGTMTLVLEALLGVEKADLIRDYELSNYFYEQVDRFYDQNGGDILTLISMLEENYAGETLADKTADMLLKAGVTQTQIDTIRSIFIES